MSCIVIVCDYRNFRKYKVVTKKIKKRQTYVDHFHLCAKKQKKN